jgi:excisionase family DNA binding protein
MPCDALFDTAPQEVTLQDTQSGKARYVTVREVAQILSISQRQVWRLAQAGELSTHKFGNCTRVSLSDLEKYVASTRTIKSDR